MLPAEFRWKLSPTAKIDAMQKRLDNLNQKRLDNLNVSAVSHLTPCAICGGMDHSALECQLDTSMPWDQEQANMVNNTLRPQNNPYSNTYNPGWRKHPNFSYKNSQGAVPPPQNRPLRGFAPRQYEPQQAPKSNLESLMEQFLTALTKTKNDVAEALRNLMTANVIIH